MDLEHYADAALRRTNYEESVRKTYVFFSIVSQLHLVTGFDFGLCSFVGSFELSVSIVHVDFVVFAVPS